MYVCVFGGGWVASLLPWKPGLVRRKKESLVSMATCYTTVKEMLRATAARLRTLNATACVIIPN